MMSALVLAEGTPEELAATLGALVPAVVDGLIGDAVVVARNADSSLRAVAEVTGAAFVVVGDAADPWRAGAAHARRAWLLCLRGGDVPAEGWTRAVDRFLVRSEGSGRPLGRFARRASGRTSAWAGWIERALGTRTVRAGDIVRREWLTAGGPGRVRSVRIAAAIEREAAVR